MAERPCLSRILPLAMLLTAVSAAGAGFAPQAAAQGEGRGAVVRPQGIGEGAVLFALPNGWHNTPKLAILPAGTRLQVAFCIGTLDPAAGLRMTDAERAAFRPDPWCKVSDGTRTGWMQGDQIGAAP